MLTFRFISVKGSCMKYSRAIWTVFASRHKYWFSSLSKQDLLECHPRPLGGLKRTYTSGLFLIPAFVSSLWASFGSCKFFPAKVSEGVLLKTSLNPLKCYFLVQIRQKRANTIILILRETAQDVIAFAPHPPPLRIGVLVDKNACNDTEKNSYNEEL